jgi:hypothetical protein
MANKMLFQSSRGALLPAATAINREGAPAYALEPKHALAQYAATGCLSNTFYAGAGEQLSTVLSLAKELDAAFIAKTAIYARTKGSMKDVPALLLAILSTKNPVLLKAAFPRVVDNGRMVRNFVQILRSGVTGRKSLGTAPKRLVETWLNTASEQKLLDAAVGADPSLRDIVRMVHPKPADATREALFGWALDKAFVVEPLPKGLQQLIAYRLDRSRGVPAVPFQMLTTAIRCIDVAALVTAAIARTNREARVLPFAEKVKEIEINPRDSLMTNAAKLAALGGGGTSSSAPLQRLVQERSSAEFVVLVSDNQSWVDARAAGPTETLRLWEAFRVRNPQAKLVCIDLQPNRTTQAIERPDVLNVGGFSDEVFEVVARFAHGTLGADHWVGRIEEIEI